jgi:hypothetical protein
MSGPSSSALSCPSCTALSCPSCSIRLSCLSCHSRLSCPELVSSSPLAAVPSLLWCPGRPVLIVLWGWPVKVGLSDRLVPAGACQVKVICPSWHVLDVIYQLSFHGSLATVV